VQNKQNFFWLYTKSFKIFISKVVKWHLLILKKEIQIKVVCYGSGRGGKGTSIGT